eukprot:GHVU01040642.1.p1 GENE.GHVU01040642.1~~GHVU01040642.1.p1  ORF type:complete len:148 (+),score=5.50 GHVU01040642.1:92-535(+)
MTLPRNRYIHRGSRWSASACLSACKPGDHLYGTLDSPPHRYVAVDDFGRGPCGDGVCDTENKEDDERHPAAAARALPHPIDCLPACLPTGTPAYLISNYSHGDMPRFALHPITTSHQPINRRSLAQRSRIHSLTPSESLRRTAAPRE